MIGLVSSVTGLEAVLIPDILQEYILKSVGHCTLFLSIVNLSCAVRGEFMFPVTEARFCKTVSLHWTGNVCPVVTDTTLSNVVLEFFSICMKNTELSCVGLVMEHTITKSFFRKTTVCGSACIFWADAGDENRKKNRQTIKITNYTRNPVIEVYILLLV